MTEISSQNQPCPVCVLEHDRNPHDLTPTNVQPTSVDISDTTQPWVAPAVIFDSALLDLCRDLEIWTTERKIALAASPSEPPSFNWIAACLALAAAVVFASGALLLGQMSMASNFEAAVFIQYVMLVAFHAGFYLFVFEALGLRKPKWWRATFAVFKRDNYPFTPLIETLNEDRKAVVRLSRFPDAVLSSGAERLANEETELRERIAMAAGSPSPLVIVGLLAAAVSGWKLYQTDQSWSSTVVFLVSVGVLILGVYGLRLRVSLLELTRCRALLSLELARRRERPRT